MFIRCRSLFCRSCSGAEQAPLTLRQIDEAEFEQRLNAVWQRDSSEARQLMEDLGSAEDFLPSRKNRRKRKICWKATTMRRSSNPINAMLAEAIKEGASDIHIETFEKSLVIRFRVDGTLHEMLRPAQTGLAAGVAYQGDGAAGHCRKARAAGWTYCAVAGRPGD